VAGEDTDRSRRGGEDELLAVAGEDDIGMSLDLESGKDRDDGVASK